MKQQLLELFRRRFACHRFQADRPIPAADLEFVLEAGRLSPSSFGLEQWKFLVVSKAEDKLALQTACFNQPQGRGRPLGFRLWVADLEPGL